MRNDEEARESKSYDAHEGKLLLTRKLLSQHAGWKMSCLTGPSNRETLRDVHRRVEPVQVEQRERRTYIANVGYRLTAGSGWSEGDLKHYVASPSGCQVLCCALRCQDLSGAPLLGVPILPSGPGSGDLHETTRSGNEGIQPVTSDRRSRDRHRRHGHPRCCNTLRRDHDQRCGECQWSDQHRLLGIYWYFQDIHRRSDTAIDT